MRIHACSLLALALLLGGARGAGEAPVERQDRNLKSWKISFHNYPKASLKAGEQGEVGFRIGIEDGKLSTCAITRSSGYPRLDTATCDLLVKYARFNSADRARTNRSVQEGTVLWALPGGRGAAVPQPPRAILAANDRDTILCRRTLKTGSKTITTKVCQSKADWQRTYQRSREQAEEMRQPIAPGVPGS